MSHRSRHSEALFGIHLAGGKTRPRGKPPGEEELALLVDGRLPEPRRGEVLSHLAGNPALYRQWQTLCELRDEVPASQPTTLWQVLARGVDNWLVDWRYAAGGIGAMAAVLLLINITTLPPQEQAAVQTLARAPEAAKQKLLEEQAPPPPAEAAPETGFAAPMQRMMAKPEADDGMADESNAGAALREQAEHKARQRTQAAIVRQNCVELAHPRRERTGALCAVLFENGEQRWVWQTRDAAEREELMRSEQRALRFRLSPDKQWLAYQSPEYIYVLGIEALFANTPEARQLPFDAGTASFRWEDNTLVISVMQALGDSDDDLIYRYEPGSGELVPPVE